MNSSIAISIAMAIMAVAFALLAYFLLRSQVKRERAAIREDADRALAEATRAGEARLREASVEAKERVLAAQVEFDRTVQARRQEVAALEKRVAQKEENLDRKLAQQEKRDEEFARKERALADAQKGVENAHAEALKVIEEQQRRLEQISGLTAADAKRDLVHSIENEARVEASGLMRRIEEEATEQATQKARHHIGMAIQRLASDTVVEATVSVVELPSDDLK
ncbi:MAG: Rnase Y domain-containing protein, partial [Acidobacteriota bacterium]|nr:Rnase Y domain-containing protein [Acidobacteriota bacterium]